MKKRPRGKILQLRLFVGWMVRNTHVFGVDSTRLLQGVFKITQRGFHLPIVIILGGRGDLFAYLIGRQF